MAPSAHAPWAVSDKRHNLSPCFPCALTTFFCAGVLSGSRFFGCVCCAWDDDDLGVYQGAQLRFTHIKFTPPRCSECGSYLFFFDLVMGYRRSCLPLQDMPSR